MAVSKIAFITANKVLQATFRSQLAIHSTNKVVWMVATSITRQLSTIKVTKSLTLLTADKKPIKVVNFKLTEPQNKPLVVLLSWLLANPKHTNKFANYYTSKGFDVLRISIVPWQMLLPTKGTQVVAANLLQFLDANKNYKKILVHGFSVGGYQWGEVLVKLDKDKERYNHIINRINGHIWDSTGDYTEMTIGITMAMFPNNAFLRYVLSHYMNFHLKMLYNIATKHYIKASELFRSDLIKSPRMVLLSKSDPIGPVSSNLRCKQAWEKAGIEVYWKCWEESPHVSHYHYHPKEYIEELENFLKRLGFLTAPGK